MKTKIINSDGKQGKEILLPQVFETKIRPDIIKKIFETIKDFQPYGAYILAGKDVSASGKQRHIRHKWKTLYGYGISRIPRKTMSRRGDRFNWIGAFIPGTRKGRAAHPPKAIKNQGVINQKEKKLALYSAIAATASKKIILEKYHLDLINLPFIIDSEFLTKKPKEFEVKIKEITTLPEIYTKKIRAGKGKLRNRKYKITKKILLVVAQEEYIQSKKLKNTGAEITKTSQLNILNLAPGGIPGRLTVYTEKAIKELGKLK